MLLNTPQSTSISFTITNGQSVQGGLPSTITPEQSSQQSNQSTSNTNSNNYWWIAVGIVILAIIVGIAKGRGKSGSGSQYVERRSFSDSVKESVLRSQNHRCNSCKRLLNVVDYDHIDGNRSNNDISNCQALCPNCHAEKSRREQMGN